MSRTFHRVGDFISENRRSVLTVAFGFIPLILSIAIALPELKISIRDVVGSPYFATGLGLVGGLFALGLTMLQYLGRNDSSSTTENLQRKIETLEKQLESVRVQAALSAEKTSGLRNQIPSEEMEQLRAEAHEKVQKDIFNIFVEQALVTAQGEAIVRLFKQSYTKLDSATRAVELRGRLNLVIGVLTTFIALGFLFYTTLSDKPNIHGFGRCTRPLCPEAFHGGVRRSVCVLFSETVQGNPRGDLASTKCSRCQLEENRHIPPISGEAKRHGSTLVSNHRYCTGKTSRR